MQHLTKDGFYTQLAIAMQTKRHGIFTKFVPLWQQAMCFEEDHKNVSYAALNDLINDIPPKSPDGWNKLDKERALTAVKVINRIREEARGDAEREAAADTAAAWLLWAWAGAPETDGEGGRVAAASPPSGPPLLHLEPCDLFAGISRAEETPSQHVAFLHLREFYPQGWGSAPDHAVRLEHRMYVGRKPPPMRSREPGKLLLTGTGTYQGWDYGSYERTLPDGGRKRHLACFLVDGGPVSRLHSQFIRKDQKWFVRKSALCTGEAALRVHPPLGKGAQVFSIDPDSGDWTALTTESPARSELEIHDGGVVALGGRLFLVKWH